MSKEALAKVVQRAISDASFRRQLSSDTTARSRLISPVGVGTRLETTGVFPLASTSGSQALRWRHGADTPTRRATSPPAARPRRRALRRGRTIHPHDPAAARHASTAQDRGAASASTTTPTISRSEHKARGGPDRGQLAHEIKKEAAVARGAVAHRGSPESVCGIASGAGVGSSYRSVDLLAFSGRVGTRGRRLGTSRNDGLTTRVASAARVLTTRRSSSGARAVNDDPMDSARTRRNITARRCDGTAFLDDSGLLAKVLRREPGNLSGDRCSRPRRREHRHQDR